MAVKFYGPGQCKSGFVGVEAFTTIGAAGDIRRERFSLKRYGYDQAEAMAHEANNRLRAIAEVVKRGRRLAGLSRWGKGTVVQGFRASILKKRVAGGVSYKPVFLVHSRSSGRDTTKTFSLLGRGLEAAYAMAVERYSQVHDLSATERATLLSKCPAEELFTHTLRLKLVSKGHEISEAYVLAKMAVTAATPNPSTK